MEGGDASLFGFFVEGDAVGDIVLAVDGAMQVSVGEAVVTPLVSTGSMEVGSSRREGREEVSAGSKVPGPTPKVELELDSRGPRWHCGLVSLAPLEAVCSRAPRWRFGLVCRQLVWRAQPALRARWERRPPRVWRWSRRDRRRGRWVAGRRGSAARRS
jgi:hypothetical protein